MTKERLSLYFDTDVEIERKMWEYICKDGKNRKSYNVKKILESVVENSNLKLSAKSIKTTNEVDSKIIKTNDEDNISIEDIPF